MQFTELNAEAQSITIPESIVNVFAQSVRANLEALMLDADMPLTLFENQEYEQVKTYLQASILQMQYLLNNVELLDTLQKK
ncbi:hypothetical protein [Microscilla marina]|uniref:Uncharacterized protein n=1 Tax=Microscilla marina ATCC 23134 TaxID=313606 RepID=A1ZYE8_MICM2|nr:hypothetical protein [Microscilla marina]EAY24621.1 hypothetical protein M23134_07732 [Microscilla marina ATCC 23134]